MHTAFLKRSIFLFIVFCCFSLSGWAQSTTTISGRVTDKETKEGLPFVNISFAGTTIGTTSDVDGNYEIETKSASEYLVASYIGYQVDSIKIELGKSQQVNFALAEISLELETVEIVAKRGKYDKDGPAVRLIKKVIENKKNNRLESNEYYQFEKYEKIEMDLNNITEKFRNRRAFRKFQFIFDYVDTSEMNGKPFLPIYLQESASSVYYRKNPTTEREYKKGVSITELEGYLDEGSMAAVMNKLYDEINIYDNHIDFLTYQFVSPLAPIAPDFYRFYIQDTIDYSGVSAIKLSFLPRNKLDFGFTGNLYITDDTLYNVVGVDMGILDEINLNFVDDVMIEQEFKEIDGQWLKKRERLIIDYDLPLSQMGMFGRRSVVYSDHKFNVSAADSIYDGTEKVVFAEDAYDRKSSFWEVNRPDTLSETEQGVYVMIDTLQKVPAFKRALKIISLVMTGYTDAGPVDIGPINAFYSFNDIEGFRVRLGGRTNLKFADKVQLEGYGAYGFNDREFKYYGSLLYSFNKDFESYPRNYLRFSYMHETKFPGQILEYVTEDNFLLSFKRGSQRRMMFYTSAKAELFKETRNNFSYQLILENRKHEPLGDLAFNYFQNNDMQFLSDIRTTEAKVNLSWSPNAQYFNTKNFRYSLTNKFPVLKLFYTYGVDGLGGDYGYHQVKFNVFKRFYLSVLGMTNVEAEAGQSWSSGTPYILLFLPRANQTFSYQNRAYNMMNFLEFVNDKYVSLNVRHYFNGFFFNKIPLLRKLKLREVATFKGLYGRLSDANNPNINPELVQFSNDDGVPITYTLEDKPYMEVSVGISNIFKILRVDAVKRLTYNNLPNTPALWGVEGLGIRARAVIEF